jgi:hypothetical protein
VVHDDAVDLDADQVRIDVEQRRDREAAAAEPAVTGQRVAEVADPDERDGLAVGQAEGGLQVPQQRADLVADPADAVRADVGQVLAQLGGVDAADGRQLVARHRLRALLGELAEQAQVHREAGDGGLRHGAPAGAAGAGGARLPEGVGALRACLRRGRHADALLGRSRSGRSRCRYPTAVDRAGGAGRGIDGDAPPR